MWLRTLCNTRFPLFMKN